MKQTTIAPFRDRYTALTDAVLRATGTIAPETGPGFTVCLLADTRTGHFGEKLWPDGPHWPARWRIEVSA